MNASSVVTHLPQACLRVSPVLEVSVLGRVEVRLDGRPLRLGRAKSDELLVFLAMHRDQGGADTDQLWEALWPGRAPNSAVLHTTVSVARCSVGAGAGRPPIVSDARGRRVYELTGPSRVDWDEFERLVSYAHTCPPAAAPTLERALALVRGIPFTSAATGSYDWALGFRADMSQAIGAAAEHLGNLLLRRGDPWGARRSARRGLRATPYDERLYRVLMRAAHAAGDAAGVDAVMLELTDRLGVDLDGTERGTRELYRDLSGGSSI